MELKRGRNVVRVASVRPAATLKAEGTAHALTQRAVQLYGDYRRWLWSSRLLVGAYAGLSLGAVISVADGWWRGYAQNAAPFAVMTAAWTAAGMALVLRELVWRQRQRLEIWLSVHDQAASFSESYLVDLLCLESERAQRLGRVFSVFVLRVHVISEPSTSVDALPETVLQNVEVWVRRLIRRDDRVGLLNSREVAIVAMGIDADTRANVLERLRVALAANVTFLFRGAIDVQVAAGVATYGADGTNGEELLEAARCATAVDLAALRCESPVRAAA